jgi:predicted ribosomally synthesized peptide with nif11-like leader
MSKENLDQFIQKVTDDEQLQARIDEEIDIESLIALGVEYGFEFTAEDVQASPPLPRKSAWV